MIKNVIFDMGNVLLDFDPRTQLDAACRSEKAKEILIKELYGGEEWIQRDLGNISVEELYFGVAARIPQEYHEDLKKCISIWHEFMIPLNGANEFLQKVKNNGYKVFILSNASEDFYTYFTRHFDLDFFDGYVVSADLHIIKPDERIYRYLLGKYDLKAEESLFIDDREDNVQGAENVGIKGFVFRNNYNELGRLLDLTE